MRIGVLTDRQTLDERPRDTVSRSAARLLLRRNAAEYVNPSKIRLKPLQAFVLNQTRLSVIAVPELLAPREPFGLLIHYPIRDQRSNHVRNGC
jgi:hypothetical protein